jgi:hypothetical protein
VTCHDIYCHHVSVRDIFINVCVRTILNGNPISMKMSDGLESAFQIECSQFASEDR